VSHPFKPTIVLVLGAILSANSGLAATVSVDIAGGGDFLQIQPAIDAAASGDTILVAPGEYAGEIRLLDRGGISIIGSGPAAAAVVRGDTIGIGLWDCTDPVRIENLEIREAGLFGGLRFQGSRAEVVDCVIRDNHGSGGCVEVGGGAILVLGSDVLFQNCLFENNIGWDASGGLIVWDSRADIIGCNFGGNQACYGGGLEFYHCGSIYSEGFAPSVCEYNLFHENSASELGGAILSVDSSPIIRFNTFVDNDSPVGTALRLMQGSPVVEYNVISGSDQPISCAGFETIPPADPLLGRNLVWGHTEPAVSICSDEGELIEADPGFCDPEGGDYTVCSDSPCLEGEFQLGAFGAGCGDCLTPVAHRNLGSVKSLFR